jgi:hypothetical protein
MMIIIIIIIFYDIHLYVMSDQSYDKLSGNKD